MSSRTVAEAPGQGDALSRLFHALADPTRRRLLARLTVGPAGVTELAQPIRMSLPAVSKHLRILERAGLVSRTVDGRLHRLSLRGAPLRHVEAWLDPFRAYWESTLEALDDDVGRFPGRHGSRVPIRRSRSAGSNRGPSQGEAGVPRGVRRSPATVRPARRRSRAQTWPPGKGR